MAASRSFYEKLRFNILTFNPGWAGLGVPVEKFTDVRELRAQLFKLGVEPSEDTTSDTSDGPASFKVTNPDGNVILIDQHV